MLKNSLVLNEVPSPSELADEVRRIMPETRARDEELLDLCLKILCSKLSSCSYDFVKAYSLARMAFCCIRYELEVLQDLAEDPKVSEIMVNGPSDVFVEIEGHIERADIKLDSKQQLMNITQRLASKVGREINDLNPIVDARLEDGSRINAVNSNIALNGPILTIRKFGRKKLTMDDLIRKGDITKEASEYIENAVICGLNIFVSGGTSSGKTTFLNILSDCIPEEERIIVIEDSSELQIRNHENTIRMEARSSNIHGMGAVTIRDLIKTSLRMRPDRIIVGEVRGDEVIDMLAAMSTGHDGSLSTGHANSPRGMLGRLETMHISGSSFPLQAVRSQIADAIDLIVQLKRYQNGHRKVTEVTEVCGIDKDGYELNVIFETDKEGRLVRTKNPVRNAKFKGSHVR